MNKETPHAYDAVETVLQQYGPMVYRLAFSHTGCRADADDVFQEVFLRYIRYRVDYIDEEHRKAWLIRTTIHCSRTLLASAWYRHTVALPTDIRTEMPEKSEVYYAVAALPAKYRTVVHLHYYEGLSVREIGELTGQKESTVKSLLFRARKKLRDALKGDIADV